MGRFGSATKCGWSILGEPRRRLSSLDGRAEPLSCAPLRCAVLLRTTARGSLRLRLRFRFEAGHDFQVFEFFERLDRDDISPPDQALRWRNGDVPRIAHRNPLLDVVDPQPESNAGLFSDALAEHDPSALWLLRIDPQEHARRVVGKPNGILLVDPHSEPRARPYHFRASGRPTSRATPAACRRRCWQSRSRRRRRSPRCPWSRTFRTRAPEGATTSTDAAAEALACTVQ